MKTVFVSAIALILLSHPAIAQTTSNDDGMTLEAFIEEAKDQQAVNVMDFDINSDNRLSKNELNEALQGFEFPALGFNDEQKKELHEKMTSAFIAADQDHDNYLSQEDCKKLNETLSTLLITYQFQKQDRNHDGVINFDDIPPIEESLQKLEENTKKLEIVSQKLQEVPPEQFANNMINSVSNSIAKEDYFGMDKNNDGCVNEDEYVTYHLESQERMKNSETQEEYQSTQMSKKDFILLYSMEKKQKPNCLTQEEYINNMQNSLNTDFSHVSDEMEETNFKEFLFTEIDIDKDGKITKGEFLTFTADEVGDANSSEDAQKIFEDKEKWSKGYLTKEEFLEIH